MRFLRNPKLRPSALRLGRKSLGACNAGSAMASKAWPMVLPHPPSPTILNRPILPYNFTEGSRPKCGSTDQDIYRIFMTGLDGTPMPSFSDNIKPDEAWDLVFYLRTLQPHNAYNMKERQIAKQLGLKPVNPNAPTAQ